MKSMIRNIVFTFACIIVLADAKAQSKEQLNIPLSSPGKAFVLNLPLPQGSIELTSYSGKEIQVEAMPLPDKPVGRQNQNQNENQNKSSNANVNVNPAEIVPSLKATAAGKYITVTESSNTVTITPINSREKLDLVIRVPKSKGRFHLTSMLHTDITISDVTGELDITSNAGTIVLNNISGSAVVSNVAGSITSSFTGVTENTPMAFSTLAGKIDVSFPSSLKANLKVDSDNGDMISDFEMDFSSSSSKPKVDPAGHGEYHIQNANKLSARIGGGGPDIRFKNMDGTIYIRKRK